jgi:uncharacterized protein YcfJ
MNVIKTTSLLLSSMSLLLLVACNEDGTMAQANTPAHVNGTRKSHEVCTDQVVTTQKPVKDQKQVLGTVAGAIVGGVVGHEIGGKGTSQDVATGVGAVAGGYAGNRVQHSVQENATEHHTERVCHTVYD